MYELGQVHNGDHLDLFAFDECRKGGEVYTPRSVVRLLVEMLEPCQDRLYPPLAAASSGMIEQSVELIHASSAAGQTAAAASPETTFLSTAISRNYRSLSAGEDHPG